MQLFVTEKRRQAYVVLEGNLITVFVDTSFSPTIGLRVLVTLVHEACVTQGPIYIYTSGFATSPPLAIRSVAFAYKTRRLAVYPAQCGYSACGNSRQLARRQPIAELSLRTQRKFPQSVPLGKTRIRQANANLLAPWPGPPPIFL